MELKSVGTVPVYGQASKGQEANGDDDDDVDMNQSLKSLRAKEVVALLRSEASDKNPKSKKQRLNLEAVPELPSSSWEDHQVACFVLGLYTFGKNFTQVKKFMESKRRGEIMLFYFGKFYNSASYHTWCDSRKKRSRKCVYGRKLYSGWRQQLLLSRLVPSVSDDSQIEMLVNDLVGLRVLVGAGDGKGKEDLTVRRAGPVNTKQWFTVSPNILRCVARLLARGWHSEKPKDRGYNTSKDNIVFIVPGVKRFSRGKLLKGDHYFDSVSDILTKVALEPELLELETGGEIVNESVGF
ncbi:hypothetical protein Bca52824_062232 [Brassica carinata]|uniref:Uncharacterized protein n=1 Tax=Brassica carinata TaxID=52824 RepID=A0A8X7U6I9_BRACI|nr:hypothetical protein Bca52824_062232 [Brassica carinata]